MTDAPYTDAQTQALSTQIRWVTPAEATLLRQTCHYDRQRDIRPQHVRRLAGEMAHGWFLAGTPIWLCVMPDRSMLLVNGNHTLEAIVEAGVSVPLIFVFQQVETLEDVAQAYACFDIQRTRTWGQAAKAAGVDDGLFAPNKTLSAVGMILSNFSGNSHGEDMASRPARFALMEEYRASANFLRDAMQDAPAVNQSYVLRSAVFGVALVTARYQPSAAEEFWGGLARDDGLRANDPRKALLRYLINNRAMGGEGRREQSLASAAAWNAFYANKPLSIPRPNQMAAFTLAGTPWAKAGAVGPVKVIRKSSPAMAAAEAARAAAAQEPVAMVTGLQWRGNGEATPVAIYGAQDDD